jgi:hypothetical protein
MSSPVQYPLFFGFREPIVGNGFVAGVDLLGRAVAEQEDASWWLFGVNPGALADTGPDVQSAFCAFRQRLKAVLFDFAEEAKGFDEFKRMVEEFFQTTDGDTETEWKDARQAVREGRLNLAELKKETTQSAPRLSVVKLRLAPEENLLDSGASSLAA